MELSATSLVFCRGNRIVFLPFVLKASKYGKRRRKFCFNENSFIFCKTHTETTNFSSNIGILKIIRQIDLVLHFFVKVCCSLTNFSSDIGI